MRQVFAFVGALIVTLALFWIMRSLIDAPAQVAEFEPAPSVEIVRFDEPDPPPPSDPPDPDRPPPRPGDEPYDVVINPPDSDDIEFEPPPNGSGGIPVRAALPADGDAIPRSIMPPQYPPRLVGSGVTGWVRVEFMINADGTVTDAAVVDASPRRNVFDDAALRAVRQWQFKPKIVNGQPVESRARYTLEFKLDDT